MLIAAWLGACSPAGKAVPPGNETTPAAIHLARPSFILHDTKDRPFPFAERTRGKLTMLFFGYTHCPDVCPVHAANLAAAMRSLTYAERQRVAVVFVTVDPAHDSLGAIRRWLDSFDSQFIGLRGDEATVDSIQQALGLGSAIRATSQASGQYEVGHASPVIVFAPDDTARAMYPFGTRQAEWAAIIPRLLAVPSSTSDRPR